MSEEEESMPPKSYRTSSEYGASTSIEELGIDEQQWTFWIAQLVIQHKSRLNAIERHLGIEPEY
jgi:hypothetical protein